MGSQKHIIARMSTSTSKYVHLLRAEFMIEERANKLTENQISCSRPAYFLAYFLAELIRAHQSARFSPEF